MPSSNVHRLVVDMLSEHFPHILPLESGSWYEDCLREAITEFGDFGSEEANKLALDAVQHEVLHQLGRSSECPTELDYPELTHKEWIRVMNFAEFIDANS